MNAQSALSIININHKTWIFVFIISITLVYIFGQSQIIRLVPLFIWGPFAVVYFFLSGKARSLLVGWKGKNIFHYAVLEFLGAMFWVGLTYGLLTKIIY